MHALEIMRINGRKLPETILRLSEILIKDPVSRCMGRLLLSLWGAEVGKEFRLSGRMRLRLQGRLRIGDKVHLRSGYSNYVGASESLAIWVSPGGVLNIGDRCGISNTTIVCRQQIDILEDTFIGGGCRIYDNDFHQLDPTERTAGSGTVGSAPIQIGPRAFLGSHCIVLKGVSIGEASIVGAGSLVTKRIPPWEIWGGVPARYLKAIEQPALLAKKLKTSP